MSIETTSPTRTSAASPTSIRLTRFKSKREASRRMVPALGRDRGGGILAQETPLGRRRRGQSDIDGGGKVNTKRFQAPRHHHLGHFNDIFEVDPTGLKSSYRCAGLSVVRGMIGVGWGHAQNAGHTPSTTTPSKLPSHPAPRSSPHSRAQSPPRCAFPVRLGAVRTIYPTAAG